MCSWLFAVDCNCLCCLHLLFLLRLLRVAVNCFFLFVVCWCLKVAGGCCRFLLMLDVACFLAVVYLIRCCWLLLLFVDVAVCNVGAFVG